MITVADLKAHLNITTDAEDALLPGKIEAAQECVEKFIGAELEDDEAFPDGVPAPLKEAVRQLASHFYENREPILVGVNAQTLPLGVFDLVGPYRTWVF